MEPRTFARYLRSNPIGPERRLRAALSVRKVAGVRFNRQVPIGAFVCDFVARTPKLVVELDGDGHASAQEYEGQLTAVLEAQGYRVVRVSNADVMRNLEGVLGRLLQVLEDVPSPRPSRTREGS